VKWLNCSSEWRGNTITLRIKGLKTQIIHVNRVFVNIIVSRKLVTMAGLGETLIWRIADQGVSTGLKRVSMGRDKITLEEYWIRCGKNLYLFTKELERRGCCCCYKCIDREMGRVLKRGEVKKGE
jgi:hypothetical protein